MHANSTDNTHTHSETFFCDCGLLNTHRPHHPQGSHWSWAARRFHSRRRPPPLFWDVAPCPTSSDSSSQNVSLNFTRSLSLLGKIFYATKKSVHQDYFGGEVHKMLCRGYLGCKWHVLIVIMLLHTVLPRVQSYLHHWKSEPCLGFIGGIYSNRLHGASDFSVCRLLSTSGFPLQIQPILSCPNYLVEQ